MRIWARRLLPFAVLGFFGVTLLPADYASPLSASRAVRQPDGGWRLDKPSLFCSDEMPAFLEGAPFREGRFAVEVALEAPEFDARDTVRVLTYSQNDVEWSFNWAVGIRSRHLVARHRGDSPRYRGAVRPHTVQHFVVSYHDGGATLFRDGEFFARHRYASTQAWARGSHLVLGNELTADRPFEGVFYLLRILDRPLDAAAAARLHAAFLAGRPPPPVPDATVLTLRPTEDGAFVLAGPGASPIPIRRVAWPFHHKLKQFWTMPRGLQEFRPHDVAKNVLGTVPLGFLLVLALGLRVRTAALLQAAASLLVETAQLFTYALRFADLTDLFANVAGAAAGALLAHRVLARLGRDAGELPT